MRTADLTTALILMAGGLLVIWDALRLGIGWGTDGPQSGFFPFWLAVLLLASLRGHRAAGLAAVEPPPRSSRRRRLVPVLKMLLPATGFVVLTQFIGLYVATGALHGPVHALDRPLLVAGGGLGERGSSRWSPSWCSSSWFLVPMPKGPLEAWLGY